MPEKPLQIATYAAGASLAAAALIYVFGPTYLFDGETTRAGSKAVGLVNPANDCFINSILQALAGLPDLRRYLIREVHRRKLDGPEVYGLTEEDFEEAEKGKGKKAWELESLRKGIVTTALKDILDKLNQRPLYRKTISAQGFVRVLEIAFRTRISRQQQDAQEFLQVVVERVCEEYHAGTEARERASRTIIRKADDSEASDADSRVALPTSPDGQLPQQTAASEADQEDGFPFEGKLESHIECETCGFKPKPSVSTFVTITLNVASRSNTTLNQCFDGLLKLEQIDDFKCDKCRLKHALDVKRKELASAETEKDKRKLEAEMERIQHALQQDPEQSVDDLQLPDPKLAPKRRIRRHMRISSFPKILAVHLSRSIYSSVSLSSKNTAKVAFPETLPLGGLRDRHKYRLLSVVCHKGGHDSGHYETFRRQVVSLPMSTPTSFGRSGVYSNRGTPISSIAPSPRLSGRSQLSQLSKESPQPSSTSSPLPEASSTSSSPRCDSPSSSSLSSRSSLSMSSRRIHNRKRTSSNSLARSQHQAQAPTSAPRTSTSPIPTASPSPSPSPSKRSTALSEASKPSPSTPSVPPTMVEAKAQAAALRPPPKQDDASKLRKKQRKANSRWWRISDEKVKESSTAQVLGMQKEVYLLFYEHLEPEEGA